jgi:hypothetical protein
MQCHDLSTNGNFLASDEVLVNGMACRTVRSAPTKAPAPAQAGQVAAAPVATVTPVAESSRFHKSSHGALLFGTHDARGQQSSAETCAKHLKEFIEKGK